MKPFASESQRYEYPLTAESIVIDAGGYRGDFAAEIDRRYQPKLLLIFEPVRDWALKIRERFSGRANIVVAENGLSDAACKREFAIQNDSTGAFGTSPTKQIVNMVDAFAIVESFKPIALAKLNIEGGEYEVISRLVATGTIKHVEHLQVQWHWVVPQAKELQHALYMRLLETHDHEWGEEPSLWQSFTLRK